MSFYGIGSNNNSFMNQFFGTGTTANNGNGISLSEWSMIKGGTYKRLLNAYYNENKNSTVSTMGNKLGLAESTKELTVAGNDAESLVKAVDKVTEIVKDMSAKYTDSDNEGKTKLMKDLYDAAAKYVEAYNSTVKSVSEVDNTSMLRNGLSITTNTAANKKMFDKMGISVDSQNKLSINEEKFMKSDINDIKTMFMGRNSYAAGVRTNAAMMYHTAEAAVATSSKAYTYTNSGAYSGFNTGMMSSYNSKM